MSKNSFTPLFTDCKKSNLQIETVSIRFSDKRLDFLNDKFESSASDLDYLEIPFDKSIAPRLSQNPSQNVQGVYFSLKIELFIHESNVSIADLMKMQECRYMLQIKYSDPSNTQQSITKLLSGAGEHLFTMTFNPENYASHIAKRGYTITFESKNITPFVLNP